MVTYTKFARPMPKPTHAPVRLEALTPSRRVVDKNAVKAVTLASLDIVGFWTREESYTDSIYPAQLL